MVTPEIQVTSTRPSAPVAAQPVAGSVHAFSFHDFLSAINPLQYLPVVGTIYRAVTGDVVTEPLRDAGSMLVSGLLGGPIGVVTYIATTIAEKATGIDPEKIVAAQLHHAPVAEAAPMATPTVAITLASSTGPAAVVPDTSAAITPALTQPAWTPQQLAAYGVRSDASGNLNLGNVAGADVLNNMELVRLEEAAAAYAANQATPPMVAARSS